MPYNRDDRQVSQGGEFSGAIQSLFRGGKRKIRPRKVLDGANSDLSKRLAAAKDPLGLNDPFGLNKPFGAGLNSPFGAQQSRPPARSPFAGARGSMDARTSLPSGNKTSPPAPASLFSGVSGVDASGAKNKILAALEAAVGSANNAYSQALAQQQGLFCDPSAVCCAAAGKR